MYCITCDYVRVGYRNDVWQKQPNVGVPVWECVWNWVEVNLCWPYSGWLVFLFLFTGEWRSVFEYPLPNTYKKTFYYLFCLNVHLLAIREDVPSDDQFNPFNALLPVKIKLNKQTKKTEIGVVFFLYFEKANKNKCHKMVV